MKYFVSVALAISVLSFSCKNEITVENSFTSSSDTIRIYTEKIKGLGVFQVGSGPLYTSDTSENFIGDIIYPDGIDSIKRAARCVDFSTMSYYGPDVFKKYLEIDIENNHIDTSICLPEGENYLNIIEGYINGRRIVIVDENYNRDLSDDSIRYIDKMEWENPDDLVEFKYLVYNGKEIIQERSWIGFRIWEGDNMLHWEKFEHILAEFTIDEVAYKIAFCRPFGADFVYEYDIEHPFMIQFKLIDDQEFSYDYFETQYLQLGQYVKLDDQYYCLHEISRDGSELTLVKENDFPNKIGIQVGMKAPDFVCVSEKGDTIRSQSLKGKALIIVNMCGCGGDYKSIDAYDQILAKFGGLYNILGVDSQFFKSTKGILINSENPFNKDFFRKYRQMYCSRATYVIDKDFRISKKFASKDWPEFLQVENTTLSNP